MYEIIRELDQNAAPSILTYLEKRSENVHFLYVLYVLRNVRFTKST